MDVLIKSYNVFLVRFLLRGVYGVTARERERETSSLFVVSLCVDVCFFLIRDVFNNWKLQTVTVSNS
jgi:hypothetical protein